MGKEKLQRAKSNKDDEFYTVYETIEQEMNFYTNKFKGKVIICNCDDPELFKEFEGKDEWESKLIEAINKKDDDLLKEANDFFKKQNPYDYEEKSSQFWLYFHKNFTRLGIKELIATHYNKGKQAYGMSYKGGNDIDIYDFEPIWFNDSDGDFRSSECVSLLERSDIVVTNPPFSLFREFLNLIIEKQKEFIIIGDLNSLTYKELFALFLKKQIWTGASGRIKSYKKIVDNKIKFVSGTRTIWFTNINHSKRNEEIFLNRRYKDNIKDYPKYVNYDAINVDRVEKIPVDYYGKIGVPVTFLLKWNPEQFEILALGITGSIEFDKFIKMEILKNNIPTNKYTINSSGKLALKYVEKEKPKKVTYRDVETNEIYEALYARLIIKRK